MTLQVDRVARLLKVLSVGTRLKILRMLKGRALCVGALASQLDVTQGAVSQHLRVMRDAGLVIDEKRGYFVHYRLNEPVLGKWRTQLDKLLARAALRNTGVRNARGGHREASGFRRTRADVAVMSAPSDEELMLAVARGDLSAFGQLVGRHQSSAWNAACRFLGNAADAEDVAQEAFLRVLDSADRYRPTAKFRTYLHRIVTRLCFDLARRRRIRRHQPLADLVANRPSPEQTCIVDERTAAIRRALDSLPPAQKMAVVLRYYEGLGYRDMAVVLATSEKGVERLLARARAALERRLGRFLDE